MKIFKRYKLSAVLAACLGTFMLAATAQAGQIDADLWQAMQNGGDVDFIVRFNDQLDLSSFPGNAKGKGMQRSALLWARVPAHPRRSRHPATGRRQRHRLREMQRALRLSR